MDSKYYEIFHKQTSRQKKIIKDNNFTFRIILGVINRYILKPSKILDIGCGAGTLAFYLANKKNIVKGIDISEKAIDICKKSAKLLNLENSLSFQVMDFPTESPVGSYDFIICSEIIEHIKNDNLALLKMFRLLKPQGLLILSTPSANAPLYKLGLLKEFDRRVGHERRYYLNELKSKATMVGFTLIEIHKTEGVLRNLLFTNKFFGLSIRFINKLNLSTPVSYIDNLFLRMFGESQIFLILKKS